MIIVNLNLIVAMPYTNLRVSGIGKKECALHLIGLFYYLWMSSFAIADCLDVRLLRLNLLHKSTLVYS